MRAKQVAKSPARGNVEVGRTTRGDYVSSSSSLLLLLELVLSAHGIARTPRSRTIHHVNLVRTHVKAKDYLSVHVASGSTSLVFLPNDHLRDTASVCLSRPAHSPARGLTRPTRGCSLLCWYERSKLLAAMSNVHEEAARRTHLPLNHLRSFAIRGGSFTEKKTSLCPHIICGLIRRPPPPAADPSSQFIS
jgi:hypothetical protein